MLPSLPAVHASLANPKPILGLCKVSSHRHIQKQEKGKHNLLLFQAF